MCVTLTFALSVPLDISQRTFQERWRLPIFENDMIVDSDQLILKEGLRGAHDKCRSNMILTSRTVFCVGIADINGSFVVKSSIIFV